VRPLFTFPPPQTKGSSISIWAAAKLKLLLLAAPNCSAAHWVPHWHSSQPRFFWQAKSSEEKSHRSPLSMHPTFGLPVISWSPAFFLLLLLLLLLLSLSGDSIAHVPVIDRGCQLAPMGMCDLLTAHAASPTIIVYSRQ